jgi:hypothetical protein
MSPKTKKTLKNLAKRFPLKSAKTAKKNTAKTHQTDWVRVAGKPMKFRKLYAPEKKGTFGLLRALDGTAFRLVHVEEKEEPKGASLAPVEIQGSAFDVHSAGKRVWLVSRRSVLALVRDEEYDRTEPYSKAEVR